MYNLNSSRANIAVVEDDEQLQKILKIKDQVPTLKCIIQYTGNPTDPTVFNVSYHVPNSTLNSSTSFLIETILF